MDELFALMAGGGIILTIVGSICATVLPLLIIGGLVIYLLRRGNKSKAYREAAQNWPTTTGEVLSSQVVVRRQGNSRTEHPAVVYQYKVDGQVYMGKVIRAGDQFGTTRLAGDARRLVERYSAGARVTVFYSPQNPADSCLER